MTSAAKCSVIMSSCMHQWQVYTAAVQNFLQALIKYEIGVNGYRRIQGGATEDTERPVIINTLSCHSDVTVWFLKRYIRKFQSFNYADSAVV